MSQRGSILLFVLGLGVAALAGACGGSESAEDTATAVSSEQTEVVEPTADSAVDPVDQADPADSAVDPQGGAASSSGAAPADLESWKQGAGSVSPAARDGIYARVGPPPLFIDPAESYEAVISLEGGDMRFRLFAAEAPRTVNNFVALASDGFYDDDVTFHRVLDQFMAQGGDPTGTGRGGPGYVFENEYSPGVEFGDRGLLAMANAGPDTNGSQFFITFDGAGFLDARDYTVFGELIDGDDVLRSIALRDPMAATEPGDMMTGIVIE